MEFETKPILRLMHKEFFFLVIRCTGYDLEPIGTLGRSPNIL